MLNCHQVTQLCSEEQDRALGVGEKMAVGMHTLVCKGCKNYRRQMKFLHLAAQAYAAGAAVPDDGIPGHKEV